ncbi:MAG: GNAT family N-acetyltransferase [Pyrinomonadaceae bacterium]
MNPESARPDTSTDSNIVIRDIESIAEMREVEELQKIVWGFSDREIVPAFTLKPTTDAGGILVGAFDKEVLVGFAYGFVGHERGRAYIHSDMLAVMPQYRNRRLGYKLKLAQRERTLSRGLTRMTWTFDPLQSRNAYLNFAKLGVLSDSYEVNYYGAETTSFLHRGVGTDRLFVTWLLDSVRVEKRLDDESMHVAAPVPPLDEPATLVRVRRDNAPEPDLANLALLPTLLALEIPDDIGALQRQTPALAAQWRETTRVAFNRALAANYLVEDFARASKDGRPYGIYLLRHGGEIKD